MEVYLVPIGATRYELYCEQADSDDLANDDRASLGVVYVRFREMVAEAQEDRRARRLAAVPADPSARQPLIIRLRNLIISWVAEAIAEQRLLWNLRMQRDVELVYPDDVDGSCALAIARGGLQLDADRHGRWLIIDGVLAVILGPLLFFVPGPNLVAYYFTFRAVGHLLSWRGARRGLREISWHTRSSRALSALRGLLSLNPRARARHVRDIEARLQLEHFAAFVERMIVGVGVRPKRKVK